MNLFEAVTQNGCVKRLGEVTLLSLANGQGGVVLDSMDFLSLRQWARRHKASENLNRDVQLFATHMENAVARLGSALPTKGHATRLLRLVKSMKTSGLNLEDWQIPKNILQELDAHSGEDDLNGKERGRQTQTEQKQTIQHHRTFSDNNKPTAFENELRDALDVLGLNS